MYEASATFAVSGGPATAFKTIIDEVSETLAALLSPGPLIREVEQMQALHRSAATVEASNPVRAAQLRREAARLGRR